MHRLTVRRARPDDIPALMRIRSIVRENVLSDPASVPAEAYQGFIDHAGIWVCQEEGRVLGFSAADPADGTVWALFVDPVAEGRGIGRTLLTHTVEDLRRVGRSRIRLTTQPGSRAERFYRRGGWVEVGLTPGGDLILELAL